MQELDTITELIAARDIKRAESQIARLLRAPLTPEHYQAVIYQRARVRLLSARPDDALEDIRHLMQSVQPVPIEYSALMADCYLARFELAPAGFADRQDVQRAADTYTIIITQYADYNNLGWVYYQRGRTALILDHVNAAEQDFRQALFMPSQLASLTAYCYERLGFIAFYEARHPLQALTYLDKAIHTCPTEELRSWLVDVYLLRSRVLSDMRHHDALASAQAALAIAREDPSAKAGTASALFVLAELYFKGAGHHAEVVDCVQQFLQASRMPQGVDVTWSRAYEMLGDACLALGRYEQATHAYLAVLQFNPYHPWEESVHLRLAHCWYLQQDYARSANILSALIDRATAEGQPVKDYRIYHALGDSWFALGNYNASASAYSKALSVAPADADTRHLRQSYEQAQNHPPL